MFEKTEKYIKINWKIKVKFNEEFFIHRVQRADFSLIYP